MTYEAECPDCGARLAIVEQDGELVSVCADRAVTERLECRPLEEAQ
jgi:hypothetical protein